MNLPFDASKGLEAKAALVPLATWLAGAVEGTQAGVDGTLICLGAQSVGIRSGGLKSTVFPEEIVSKRVLKYCRRMVDDDLHSLPLLGSRLSTDLCRSVAGHCSCRPLDALLLVVRGAHCRWDGGAAICRRSQAGLGGKIRV